MGTLAEWTRVLEVGVIFAAAMLLLDLVKGREEIAKLRNLFATAFTSLMIGMIEVFRWQVLHGAIGLLFFGLLVVGVGTALALRRAQARKV